MRIILTFAVNAGLNFVLALVVAGLLGPGDYGRYAVAMAAALVVNTLCLDWLKLSATRFYSERSRAEAPATRASLDLAQSAISIGIVGCGLGLIVGGVDLGLPAALVAATAAAGVATASFDYHAAIARARFLDGAYALLVLVKNVASFVLMVGGAWLFRDPALVIAGFCLSVCAALLAVRSRLVDDGVSLRQARMQAIGGFLRYGLPLVAANGLYQIMPLVNRSVAAGRDGFSEAGLFALAADVGVRLFASIGSSLDIFLFQVAVRADAEDGREAARAQVSRNITAILALMLPTAAGYWLLLPVFEALLVPVQYHGTFAAYSAILVPAFLAFALAQYALNPVFQLEMLTWPVTLAAGLGLAVDLALLAVLPGAIGPLGYAWAQLGGYAASVAVLAVLAARIMPIWPTVRELAAIVGGTALLAAAVYPLRGLMPPLAAAFVLPAIGAIVYGGVLALARVAGMRELLVRIVSRTAGRYRPG